MLRIRKGDPPHPHDIGKSAQRIDSKRVAWRPWRKRVCNCLKTKGIDGKHAGTSEGLTSQRGRSATSPHPPRYFVSADCKELSFSVSRLESTFARCLISVNSKRLRRKHNTCAGCRATGFCILLEPKLGRTSPSLRLKESPTNKKAAAGLPHRVFYKTKYTIGR